jgi:protein gp37
MFRDQVRYGRDPEVVVRAAPATFNAPLKWTNPMLVFTCSWSDFFHPDADDWRAEAWSIMRSTPHLTYQVLTKRSDRIADHLPPNWGDGYPNGWLGVSAENQYWADRRVPALLRIPATVRFVSAEPLLKPIDFTALLGGRLDALAGDVKTAGGEVYAGGHGLDWIIAGGESGGRPGHPPRVMKPEWVRYLRDQCVANRVPYFLKQWGGSRPGGSALLDGREWREMPESTHVQPEHQGALV